MLLDGWGGWIVGLDCGSVPRRHCGLGVPALGRCRIWMMGGLGEVGLGGWSVAC